MITYSISNNYLEYSKSIHTVGSHRNICATINLFNTFFKNNHVEHIKLIHLYNFFQQILSKNGIYQARIHRINLSGFFQWMVDMEILETNIVRKIKPFKIPQKQSLYVTENELLELLPYIKDEQIKMAVRIAFYTGMRQMEILTLRWEQIHDNIIHLDNQTHITKSKQIRNIPISPKIQDIFQHPKTGFIFPQTKNYPFLVSKHFKRAIKKSKLNPKLHFHNLRSGFATRAVQVGIAIPVLQKLMGHADIKTTMIYASVQDNLLTDAINML